MKCAGLFWHKASRQATNTGLVAIIGATFSVLFLPVHFEHRLPHAASPGLMGWIENCGFGKNVRLGRCWWHL